jgi:hypothetical protein
VNGFEAELDIKKIVEVVQKAGLTAQHQFHEMSFDTLVADGPEYFASVIVAQALSNHWKGGNVGLEQDFGMLRELGRGKRGARKRGQKNLVVSHSGKVDLVLWQDEDENPRPRFLVEVKMGMSQINLRKDIDRLANMVHELGPVFGGTVIGGALVVITEDTVNYNYQKRRKSLELTVRSAEDAHKCRVSIKLSDKMQYKFSPPLYKDSEPEDGQVEHFNSDCVVVVATPPCPSS